MTGDFFLNSTIGVSQHLCGNCFYDLFMSYNCIWSWHTVTDIFTALKYWNDKFVQKRVLQPFNKVAMENVLFESENKRAFFFFSQTFRLQHRKPSHSIWKWVYSAAGIEAECRAWQAFKVTLIPSLDYCSHFHYWTEFT